MLAELGLSDLKERRYGPNMGGQNFLDRLTEPQRSQLAAVGVERTFQPGAYLCFEGDESRSVFVLLEGLVRIERTTTAGRRVLLTLSGDGELFGELGVLDPSPRSAAVQAIDETRCIEIQAADFEQLVRDDLDLLLVVTRMIAQRVRNLSDQLVQATAKDIVGRVAARLCVLARREAMPGPILIRMPITQQELGQWAGLSRESTAKALHALREAGIVSTGRGRIVVHDFEALLKLAGGE